MSHRCLAALFTMAAVVLLAPAGGAAQSWEAPVTPWGDPDLQGSWTNTTTTPLERPAELADQDVLTDEERAARDEAGLVAREQRGIEPGTG